MDILRMRWSHRLANVRSALSNRYDQALCRLGWRRPRDEQASPPRRFPPGPARFWRVLGSMSTPSPEGMVIPVVRLAPVLRRFYPELQSPYAWRAAFQQWCDEETENWRQEVLDAVFTQLWSRSAFHEVVPAIEEPNLAQALQAEELGQLTRGQDGPPVEMEIDQDW